MGAPATPAAPPDTVTPRSGLVITRDTRVRPGTWILPLAASDSAVLTIRGSHITVDLRGAVLRGQPAEAAPDQARGIAILVEGGEDVTILGGGLHGYRFGVVARGTTGLVIDGVDASYGWKPRLWSGVTRESLVDWLSFHRNDAGEWRRFGAGFLLEGVRGGRLTGARAVQGMNGLLLAGSDQVTVRGNTFAFNSGLGIGLYRARQNVIVGNTLDYNVRGYSHGHYARGQDSAALLLFEQSSENLVAWNSATHSGDGFFLWAGQETMDSGAGGSNDNLVVGNDFRWAPTNAIEATFSRNRFVGNRASGSTHGMWGGYSWSTEVTGNCFGGNRVGIALEHGQDNRITGNRFEGDSTGIRLWANPIEPSDWGYPRFRDTRSRDHVISGNAFTQTRVAIRASATSGLVLDGNLMVDADTVQVLDSLTRADLDAVEGMPPSRVACGPGAVDRAALPESIRDEAPAPGLEAERDRAAILIGEWGPFDWRSPALFPIGDPLADSVQLRVVGPPGEWRLASHRGLAAPPRGAGAVGDTIMVRPAPGPGLDWAIELVYAGGDTRSPRGVDAAAGIPVSFGHAVLEPGWWQLRFFVLPGDSVPPGPGVVDSVLAGAPLLERTERALALVWYTPPWRDIPREHLLVEATAEVTLPPGRYTLGTISDDGVRVWVDGALVIDHWAPHESALAFAPLSGGTHQLRVIHYQREGWTELRTFIEPGERRSPGSPGPH